MARSSPDCRQCHHRPARAADDFCSDVCERDWHRRCTRSTLRETAEGEGTADGWVYGGHQRANLQNSA